MNVCKIDFFGRLTVVVIVIVVVVVNAVVVVSVLERDDNGANSSGGDTFLQRQSKIGNVRHSAQGNSNR